MAAALKNHLHTAIWIGCPSCQIRRSLSETTHRGTGKGAAGPVLGRDPVVAGISIGTANSGLQGDDAAIILNSDNIFRTREVGEFDILRTDEPISGLETRHTQKILGLDVFNRRNLLDDRPVADRANDKFVDLFIGQALDLLQRFPQHVIGDADHHEIGIDPIDPSDPIIGNLWSR